MSPGRHSGFLTVLVLLLVVGSCWDEEKSCSSSADCARTEICAGPGAGPFSCLEDCTTSGTCTLGGECVGLTNADCPTCDVVTKACLVNRPFGR